MTRAVLVALALVACAPDRAYAPRAQPVEPIVLDPAPPTIQVGSGSGDLQVYVVEGDGVTIHPQPGPGDGWVWDHDDARLAVTSVCDNGYAGCGTSFVIEVPAAQVLDLTTIAGDIVLHEGYAGAAMLRLRTGAASAADLGPADLDVLGETGPVALSFAQPPLGLSALTSTADIAVEVPSGAYDYALDTTGETTVFRVARGDGPNLILASTTGAISLTGY